MNDTVFERLAEYLQGIPCEFRQLVEKKYPVMGEAHFTRLWDRATDNKSCSRDRVVRRAEW